MGAALRLVAATIAAVSILGCSSNSDTNRSAAASLSTLLDPASGVEVPFTADDGALVVKVGPSPADVTEQQAVTKVNQLRSFRGRPPTLQVLAGRVTLEPGLSPTPIVDEPAWVIQYTQVYFGICPDYPIPGLTDATAPPSASQLTAIIVTSTVVVGYMGAGSGPCSPRPQPQVFAEADLMTGRHATT